MITAVALLGINFSKTVWKFAGEVRDAPREIERFSSIIDMTSQQPNEAVQLLQEGIFPAKKGFKGPFIPRTTARFGNQEKLSAKQYTTLFISGKDSTINETKDERLSTSP